MGSPENTLTNFDLDLLLCSASTSITENTGHGYQTQTLELAGSKTQSYQVQNMGIPGSTDHSYQIPNMGSMGTGNQVYQVQNIAIPGSANYDYQIPQTGNMRTGNQGYQVQNIGITQTADHSYQIQNMGTNQGNQVQNMRNELSFSGHVNNEVVKKSDHDLESRLQKLSADFTSLQNAYDAKNKDYDAVKKQYAKLASDYANLNTENNAHAMASLNITAKCENLEQKEVGYLATINALSKQCEKQSVDIYAQSKQFLQFQSYVEELRAVISNLKNDVKSEKYNGKDSRKMISTLTSNNKTLTEHLCLFACVIEGRKQLDKETRRYIKKYCKKSTSGNKKSVETESFENKSDDTGRGSSLASSDGDRSLYSPSYSITFSPFSTGAATPRNEPTKTMRDASSSPPPMTETFAISTSPIIFEEAITTPSAVQTCDVATNTIHYEAKTTRDITTSPIVFDDTRPLVADVPSPATWSITASPTEFDIPRIPVTPTKTIDIAINPIMFADTETPKAKTQTWSITASPTEFDDPKTPLAPTKTIDIAVSPIMFADTETPNAKVQTWSITASPTEFDDPRTPVAPIKTIDIAVSPIMFADTETPKAKTQTWSITASPTEFDDPRTPVTPTKTIDIAVSPIMFADEETPKVKAQTRSITTSPIKFVDQRTPVTPTKMIDIAISPIMFPNTETLVTKAQTRSITTSPIEFDDPRIHVAPTKTIDIAVSPIMFADTETLITKAHTRSITTSPIEFDDTRTHVAPTKTINIAVSPIMFADTETPKAKTLNTATSPVMFYDMITPIVKTQTLNTATSPVKFDDIINPAAKIKTSSIATSPIVFEDTKSPNETTTKTSNMAISPIMFAVITSVGKTKPFDIATSPITCGDAKITAEKTRSLQTSARRRPIKGADARSLRKSKRLLTTNSPSTENLKYVNSVPSNCNEDRLASPVPVSKYTDSQISTASHINKISEKLKEIVSKQAEQSQDDAENDWEIKMILSKHKLNWALLSPMSLSPEVENKQTQSERKDEIKKHSCHINKNKSKASEISAQSVHLFGEDHSDDEIDSEDMVISDLPIENPEHVANSDDAFDFIKSAGENDENENIKQKNSIEDIESESPDEISNKNLAKPTRANKTRGTLMKYKKLTNLQKIYKANVPKCKIKSQHLTSVRKQKKRPKSHSIPPIINSVAALSHVETLLRKRQDVIEIYRQSKKCSLKEPLVLPESSAKSGSSESLSKTGLPLTQTIPPPESDPKTRVCIQTKSNRTIVSQTQENPSEFCQKKTYSELPTSAPKESECMPIGIRSNNTNQANPLSEFGQKKASLESPTLPASAPKRECIPTGIRSNNMSVIPHSLTNHRKDTCGTSDSSSNSKCELSKVQTNLNPPCGPSLSTGLIIESDAGYTNPNPIVKRISRVIKGISINTPVLPSDQTESNNNETCTNKGESQYSSLKRPANDLVINEESDVKRKRISCIAQQNVAKSDTNMETSQSVDEFVNDSKNSSSSDQRSASLDVSNADTLRSPDDGNLKSTSLTKSPNHQTRCNTDYNDMTMFTVPIAYVNKKRNNNEISESWSHNLMDRMLYKYASKPKHMEIPKCEESIVLKIQTGIAKCVKSMSDQDQYTKALQQLVQELVGLGERKIVSGLMKFLNDPERRAKFVTNKAQGKRLTEPTASETEMALIDVIELLDKSGVVLWDLILDSAEFILFTLERGATPVFDVVDIVAHFYANICRYRRNISRMWMFMLNAMYCLSFKAIPLIKHCFDVMPEIIPYSNKYIEPGLAPLIRCLVFLLNFYNCNDPYKRVDEIRRRLRHKYYYNIHDENETTLLFLLRQSIINLTEKKLERDMLELSFLIVAKRRGTKWCHKNIVQKILLPMIKGDIDVSYRAKRFCVTTIGYIVKPYNNEMVVHVEEIVNLLMNMFNQQTQPQELKEDIIRGLINMDMRTITDRINTCLFNWNPPSISSELEETLESYVCKTYIKNWLAIYKDHYKEI